MPSSAVQPRTAGTSRDADVSRRRWIAQLVLWAAAAPARAADTVARWTPQSVPSAEPIRQLHPGGPSGLLGTGGSGALWALSARGDAPRRLAQGLDPGAPLAAGHGRIAARAADGALWTLEGESERRSAPSLLAPHSGLLNLPLAVIGISAGGGENHVVLRLEPEGRRGWSVAARSADPVLPDARPLQADLEGNGDGGHVVVLAGPDRLRYDHGVLGDAVEATRILWLDRHSLKPMRELSLPPPQVFEDIAPRAIVLARG
ncbi:MAG: hypothetical protein ABIQ06_02450, partial [Caldimonas sp.]